MSKTSFKEFLREQKVEEYYKYFNSFSDVIDHKGDEKEKEKEKDEEQNDGDISDDSTQTPNKDAGITDRGEKEDYNPTRMRQWMEISISGD